MVWTIKRRKRTSIKTVLVLVGYAPDCANQCKPCESHDLAQSVFYLHTPKEFFLGRKDEIHWERVKRLPLRAMRDWQRKVGLNIFEIINRKKKTPPLCWPNKQTNKQTKIKKNNDNKEWWVRISDHWVYFKYIIHMTCTIMCLSWPIFRGWV